MKSVAHGQFLVYAHGGESCREQPPRVVALGGESLPERGGLVVQAIAEQG